MANEIYTSLRAKGIGPIFHEYFKTNAVVLAKGVKEDYIQILTKSYTPYRGIAMLSAKMGNIDIIHFWCDNDSFGNDKYENIWNNGKLIKSYVYPFNYDKDDYDEKVEVSVTDEFNIYLDKNNEELQEFIEQTNDIER